MSNQEPQRPHIPTALFNQAVAALKEVFEDSGTYAGSGSINDDVMAVRIKQVDSTFAYLRVRHGEGWLVFQAVEEQVHQALEVVVQRLFLAYLTSEIVLPAPA